MPHQLKSHPRKNGKDSRACRITGRNLGLIRKYDLLLCRQSFRENAEQIGFVKYRWTTLTIDRQELIQLQLAWTSLPSRRIAIPQGPSKAAASWLPWRWPWPVDSSAHCEARLIRHFLLKSTHRVEAEKRARQHRALPDPSDLMEDRVLSGSVDCSNCLNTYTSSLSYLFSLSRGVEWWSLSLQSLHSQSPKLLNTKRQTSQYLTISITKLNFKQIADNYKT